MRAGVLSDDQVIKFLNENFINIWVSNVALERTPRKKAYMAKRPKSESDVFNKTHPLAQAIMEGWTEDSPVDCLVIAPEYDVMGKLPLNDFFDDCYKKRIPEVDGYMNFLTDALDSKFPGFNENTTDSFLTGSKVVLKNGQLEQRVLDILRAPSYGYQDYNVIEIDTTQIMGGGELVIEIQMGNAKSGGSFDLFDENTELPTKGIPTEAVAGVWDVPSGMPGTIRYHFDRGQVFKLGATGTWFSGKGNVNAFLATISVKHSISS